jgi:hypothetical protein
MSRQWTLGDDDRMVQFLRAERMRDKIDAEPIVCPKCNAVRAKGDTCFNCGTLSTAKVRKVLQADGTLKNMTGDFYKARRIAKRTPNLEAEWIKRCQGVRNSRRAVVQRMTFAQVRISMARDHNWEYPPKDLPGMPKKARDWLRRLPEVPGTELHK